MSTIFYNIRECVDHAEECERIRHSTFWAFIDALCVASESEDKTLLPKVVKLVRNRKVGGSLMSEEPAAVELVESLRCKT